MSKKFKSVVNCILCKKSKLVPHIVGDGYVIVRCTKCDLLFINPRLEAVEEVYENNAVHTNYYEHTELCDKKEFETRLKFLEKYCTKGKILDVGCATGTFLKLVRKKWDAYGIDPNSHSIDVCKKAGLNVKKGFLSANTYPKNFFDVIHMSDSIEHMEDPLETLKKCYGFLKPGGFIMIATPNFSSMWARMFQIKPTDHLYYFTEDTLKKTVSAAGFEPLFCKPINRLRDMKAIEHSTSIKPSLLAKVFFKTMRMMPGKTLCIRPPFRDDLLLFARKPDEKMKSKNNKKSTSKKISR